MQLIVYTNPADNSAMLFQDEISKMPYPRFMSYADSGLKDVATVLAKMIENARLLEGEIKSVNQPIRGKEVKNYF